MSDSEHSAGGETRIGKQIALPWSKAVEIAAKSIRVRFWRSMITMSSIILAIAFLMSIWTATAICAALAAGPVRDIEETREKIRTVRATLEERPDALSPEALKEEFASDLEDAIDKKKEEIKDAEDDLEEAGTEDRKKLLAKIEKAEEMLQEENHVALLHQHLVSERERYEAVRGKLHARLEQERGRDLLERVLGVREEGEEARAAITSSVVDFLRQMTPTDTWLVILALLVCLVGIANSMFMTVQERFREIGTMKCLGAVDGFIVKIFLVESASLGFIGTLLGVVLGLLLSSVRQLFVYGTQTTVYFPVVNLLVAAVFAALIGLVLSVSAAIWPAQKAARMEPVEAMRIEE
ncbi:MAG: FtsX-like permease family protein [Candidatus Brocadiia bacterium]